jgi:N-succinyldiaminopimelate aminotransferase
VNPRLAQLQAYPFERLAALKRGVVPPAALAHIALSIGEPQHAPPQFVLDALAAANPTQVGGYPATRGTPELRAACAAWLTRRFALPAGAVDPETMLLPVNGTREALFAFAQAIVDTSGAQRPVVALPNPFYQIYEGAALLAGAEPCFVPATAATGYLPDLDAVPEETWRRCQLLFLCSPGNPAGAIMSIAWLRRALALAERHDFVIAADECYAELYFDDAQPPPSLLDAARADGRTRFERCMVFHSLSKRSSVPGLRSGFVAGDPALIAPFLLYRTYHGSAMPGATQVASALAWGEDTHAAHNRALYREKFARVLPILAPVLPVTQPEGGFYLWPEVGGDDVEFTRALFERCNVTLLPGSYLARPTPAGNPGAGRVRISLVASVDLCVEAAQRIRGFVMENRK